MGTEISNLLMGVVTINEETPIRKILSVTAAAGLLFAATAMCLAQGGAQDSAPSKMPGQGSVRASPAPPATLPVSGCRTKEANPVSRGLPATPRVNETQQVDREAAAAGLTRDFEDALTRCGGALRVELKLRERCAGKQTCPSSCPGKLSEPP